MDTLLIYGSYGYTGRLIAREAASRERTRAGGREGTGETRVIVAGRDGCTVTQQAEDVGVEARVFGLESTNAAAANLADVDVVVNCAGPFVETVDPLIEACLETGTEYLDITGEVAVFERLRQRDAQARAAGVTMLPGVGFEVVPSDCLAAFLADQVPDADELTLGIDGNSLPSAGTARTVLDMLGSGGIVRRNGRLVEVPAGFRTRRIDFGAGPEHAVTVPWGDVVTAAHSTGIESIEVYAAAPSWAGPALSALDAFGWLLDRRPVERTMMQLIDACLDGPDEQALSSDEAVIWGEARTADGDRKARARMRTPNPYALTAEAAVTAAHRVLADQASDRDDTVSDGFQTPATAFGTDFVLELARTEREVLKVDAPTDEDATERSAVEPLD